MKRRLAREIALQTLFQLEFSDIEVLVAKRAVFEERELNIDESNSDYVEILLKGVTANKAAIDDVLMQYATHWKLDRMAIVDRNILRIAVYELKFAPEKLTANIIINEAIEIAKIYGSDNSSKFINGILGKLINECQA